MGKCICRQKIFWIAEKMKISNFNLSYCLNAFDFTQDYKNVLEYVNSIFKKVRRDIGKNDETLFALGIWTSNQFLKKMRLDENLQYIREFLDENYYYISTINAFPYNVFHNQTVKDKVYMPNWIDPKRVDFTIEAADFLKIMMHENSNGTISTLPGGYGKHLNSNDRNLKIIADNINMVAEHLNSIYEKTGKKIRLAIEMEPDCIWETPSDFANFFEQYLASKPYAPEYVGVCYDTCHQELIETKPGEGIAFFMKHNIKIVKIQLSASLQILNNENFGILEKFDEQVYLHQTRLFDQKNGKIIKKFADIPNLNAFDKSDSLLKCHFHLPIFWDAHAQNFSPSRNELIKSIAILKSHPEICEDIEIETYTYSVLPDNMLNKNIQSAIAEEYKWVLKCLI